MKIWLYLLCAIPETSLSASRGLTQRPPVGGKTVTKAATSTLRSSPTIVPLYTISNLSFFASLRSSPTIVPLYTTSNLSTSASFETSSRAQELTDNASLMLLIVTIAMLLILCAQLLLISLLRGTLRRHYNQCVEEIKKLVNQMYGTKVELSTDKGGALDNIVITATPNAQSTMVTLALGTGAAVNPPKSSAMKEAIKKFKTLAMGLDNLEKRPASPLPETDKNEKKEEKLLPSTPVEPTALKKDDHYFSVRNEKPDVPEKQKLPSPAPVVPTPTKDEHYFSVRKEKVEVAVPEQKPQKEKLPPPAPLEPNTPKKDEHYFSVRKEKVEVAVPEQNPQKQALPPPTPLKPNTQKKEEDFFSLPKTKT